MKLAHHVRSMATLAVAVGLATAATAQVKVGVVSSATGPTALVGIPQKNTVPLLPKQAKLSPDSLQRQAS